MRKYYIAKWKNGQDFAKVVNNFGHNTENEALEELVLMHAGSDPDEVRKYKQFCEDTTNWGIFYLNEDEETGQLEPAITSTWGGRNFKSNQVK
ncbi:MAG: hypothetical protein ACOC4B_00805 [Bacteroidota bacterium]